jgi:uncharacterized DUF497 family protein
LRNWLPNTGCPWKKLKKSSALSPTFGKSGKGEHVYAAYGQSATGRYLMVFYIRKLTGALLPISARDMDEAERRY